MILLIICAGVLGVLSVLTTSEVSSGPVVIGIALLFAVFARINQAQAHHRDFHNWRVADKRKAQQSPDQPA
jgi:hypothetical protein